VAEIFHHFSINATPWQVFLGISTPKGLDTWWTKRSSGEAKEGTEYELWFGPDYDWRAVVSQCVADKKFELKVTEAHEDLAGNARRFPLEEKDGLTLVRFHHLGWPEANDRAEALSGIALAHALKII